MMTSLCDTVAFFGDFVLSFIKWLLNRGAIEEAWWESQEHPNWVTDWPSEEDDLIDHLIDDTPAVKLAMKRAFMPNVRIGHNQRAILDHILNHGGRIRWEKLVRTMTEVHGMRRSAVHQAISSMLNRNLVHCEDMAAMFGWDWVITPSGKEALGIV